MTLKEKRFFQKHKLDAKPKTAIAEAIKEILFSKAEIVFAYLHGSFIKDKTFRDIDIAVFTSENRGFNFESSISIELTDSIGIDVEVRVMNNAPVAFQMAVVKEGKLLFSRNEEERTDFMERVCRRYREYSHFRNLLLGIDGRVQNVASG